MFCTPKSLLKFARFEERKILQKHKYFNEISFPTCLAICITSIYV